MALSSRKANTLGSDPNKLREPLYFKTRQDYTRHGFPVESKEETAWPRKVALADVVRTIQTMGQQFMNNVAAKNAGLAQMVGEKKFRADLYYRLNIFPIEVPPLRDRRDLPPLARHFVD